MDLIDYYTDHGHRTAIVKTTGRKFIHLYMIGETTVRRVPLSEARYFTPIRKATPKDVRRYNAASRARGGKSGYVNNQTGETR